MKIEVRNRCSDFDSYRAARVKSLFNAESGCNFDLTADLPIDDDGWKLGVIVGPSGSGKTSAGRKIFGEAAMYDPTDWPSDKPIVDAVTPGGSFDDVTAAFAAVGLGSVPTWLRPFPVLSNGEKFRANLARVICEKPRSVVIDEFTSVVDRQIAKFGALAFQKAWRRTGGKCVLLSCHYDVIEWLEPDWIFDTQTGMYAGRSLWRRPKFELEIWQTDWRYWPLFEPHHYLKLPRMIAAKNYVGTVDGELVCHIAVGTANKGGTAEARACRLVVMPEWQGAGIGIRFLDSVCELQLTGGDGARLAGRKVTTAFHTSHPGLAAALRRNPKWRQVSAKMHGTCKTTSRKTRASSAIKKTSRARGHHHGPGDATATATATGAELVNCGYGGHFRAVQGFRYYGEAGKK